MKTTLTIQGQMLSRFECQHIWST